MARDRKSAKSVELPTLGVFLRLVAIEAVAAVIVGLQGLAVGLFRSGHGSGSFVLHVLVGSLPIVVAFFVALISPIPALFVFGAAAAMLGTSIVVIVVHLLGGLPSGEAELVKFAVAAYGSYLVALYAWTYYEFRKAGRSGRQPGDWIFVYKQVFELGQQLGLRLTGSTPETIQPSQPLAEDRTH
jgi:hypothetical protein